MAGGIGRYFFVSLVFLAIIHNCLQVTQCQKVDNGGAQGRRSQFRKEQLDPDGKYVLEWAVDWTERTITFNITAETIGWVGFGLSNNGKMSGADVIIGGMHANGVPYFSDRHAVTHQVPVKDSSQDWTMLDCIEMASHTYLSVKRKLDTCDSEDYPITENRVSLIWALGGSDKVINYHRAKRGSYNVYLLEPNWAPRTIRDRNTMDPEVLDDMGTKWPEDLKVWTIPSNLRLPRNETSYFCSMHRAPRLSRKHHMIGFEVFFENEASRASLHHMDIFKCNVPRAGVSNTTTPRSLFGRYVGAEPQACYNLLQRPTSRESIPTQYCTELSMIWAKGERRFFNPDHIGFPFGNDNGEEEFYMTQIHFDNPTEQDNLLMDLRLDFFYTAELRPNEAGVMEISHTIPGQPESFLLPPSSLNYRMYGHCSPECSRRMLGPGGSIKIYGVILHSHATGKKIRLHHFRGGKELPWISFDDNWTVDYQPIRNLREEREVRAGDQLTVDCVYDTTLANGTTVVGGYSARQEMCLASLVYYNRIYDYHYCHSEVVSVDNRAKFLNGVRNVTWSQDRLSWVVTDDTEYEGYSVAEISDNFVAWDENSRVELQREQTLKPHQGTCYREPYSRAIPILPFEEGLSEDDFRGPVHYPLDVDAYYGPEKECNSERKL